MQHTIILKLAKEIAEIISSRAIVVQLKNRLLSNSEKLIVLDFSSVVFISRSAAHELILLKEELQSYKRQIEFVHMNKDVEIMFNTVRQHRVSVQNSNFSLPKVMDINLLSA